MNLLHSNKSRVVLALAAAGSALAGQAQACSLDISHPSRYANCLYNDAVNEGTQAGNKEYKRLVAAANAQAGDIQRAATNDARTIRDNADQKSRDIAAAATKTVEQFRARSAAITQGEYTLLVATYDQSLKAAQSTLSSLATTALTVKALDAATAARLRAAGSQAIDQQSVKLLDLQARFSHETSVPPS